MRNKSNSGWRVPAAFLFPVFPALVLLEFFDAEPLHVWLPQAEELDEVSAIDIAYILGLDGVVPAHLLGDDLKVS